MNNKKLDITLFQPKYLNSEKNEPIIFSKKVNNNPKVIPLNIISSDTGKTRHFTPAAQEWHNSVYAYNSNYIKTIPTADRNLITLLKSYFNINYAKNHRNVLNIKDRLMRSVNKIFVGKGELKHTSDKVIITMYIYNWERKYLLNEVRQIYYSLFTPKLELKMNIAEGIKGNKIIKYNRPFTLSEYLSLGDHYINYLSITLSFVKNLNKYLYLILEYNKHLIDLVNSRKLNENEKNSLFIQTVNSFNNVYYTSYSYYMDMVKKIYLKQFYYYLYSLKVNEAKFQENFMYKLRGLIKNLYNKEIEFNIIFLNNVHSNSDIFTQAVAIKLRNRDNNLHRVLKFSLSKVNIPNIMRMNKNSILRHKEEILVNLIRNKKINNMFNENIKKDSLNDLLLNVFPLADEIKVKKRSFMVKHQISLINYIFKVLKHRHLGGIRIEAKGRLTKRFTASRSIFKMRWKGGLKNEDSSFKGLSTIMLRGHAKSNIQYSFANSKTRNGAFGVKGWVSNK